MESWCGDGAVSIVAILSHGRKIVPGSKVLRVFGVRLLVGDHKVGAVDHHLARDAVCDFLDLLPDVQEQGVG